MTGWLWMGCPSSVPQVEANGYGGSSASCSFRGQVFTTSGSKEVAVLDGTVSGTITIDGTSITSNGGTDLFIQVGSRAHTRIPYAARAGTG